MLAMKYVAANSEYSAVICFGVVVLASNVRVTCSMVVVLTSFVTVWGHSFGFRCRDNLLRSRDFDFRCRGNDYLFVFETFQRHFHHLAGDCLPIVGGTDMALLTCFLGLAVWLKSVPGASFVVFRVIRI